MNLNFKMLSSLNSVEFFASNICATAASGEVTFVFRFKIV